MSWINTFSVLDFTKYNLLLWRTGGDMYTEWLMNEFFTSATWGSNTGTSCAHETNSIVKLGIKFVKPYLLVEHCL